MRRNAVLILLAVVALSCAGDPSVRTDLDASAWKRDLEYLAKELPARHVDAFHRMRRDDFTGAAAAFESQIDSLAPHQTVLGFGWLVATLGDAHTELLPFQPGTGFHRLPVILYFFEGDAWVTGVPEPLQNLAGKRLVEIGGASMPDVIERMKILVARDNDAELLHSGPEYLVTPEVLQTFELAGSLAEATFVLEDSSGVRDTVVLNATERALIGTVEWMNARELAGNPAPLAAKHPDRNYWLEQLNDTKTLYVNYGRCEDQIGAPSVAEFATSIVQELRTHDIQNMVIDLRTNAGGDNTKNRALIDAIKSLDQVNRRGRLFVLLGRTTFSAGLDFAASLMNEANAIFIGETPRGNVNGFGDWEELRLPNSKLRLTYSTRRYDRMPDLGDGAQFPLDSTVTYTIDDYRNGRDPFLETAIGMASQGAVNL